ncbi:MAG: hypothetical protein WBD93_10350, partial [Acidobacteriaceae bacterium]
VTVIDCTFPICRAVPTWYFPHDGRSYSFTDASGTGTMDADTRVRQKRIASFGNQNSVRTSRAITAPGGN